MTGVEIRRLVYLQQFTANTIPIFPAYAIMFNDRSGLSTSQISALFIICNIAAMVSEVPTGVLADHLSRRVVMLFSTLLTGLTFVTWLVFPSFLGYSAGFVLWGVGFAMASGALQAYLFDQLKLLGRLDEFTKAFSRSRAFSYGGMFLGYGAAIVIGIEHYELLLGLSIAACAISIVVTLLLPKDRVSTSIARQRGHLRSALSGVRRSPILRRSVLTIALVGATIATVEDYAPLYFSAIEVSFTVIPYLLLVGLCLGIVATWFAHRFEHRPAFWLVTMMLLAGIVLFVSSFADKAIAVLGMLAFIALLRFAVVLLEASMQHEFHGTSRATLGSLPTLLNEVSGVGLAALYGLVAHRADDLAAIRSVAALVVLVGASLMVWWSYLPRQTSHSGIEAVSGSG